MKEVRGIAEALKTSVSELLASGASREAPAHMLFRRAAVRGGKVPENVVTTLADSFSSTWELLGHQSAMSTWRTAFKQPIGTLENAEANAEVFRNLFFEGDQFSPLTKLPQVVSKAMGVMLFAVNMPHIDGASAVYQGTPFIFVSKRFPGRMLFTLAHEIGHVVSHHDVETSFAIIDKVTETKRGRRTEADLIERYADSFASALLMPSQGVGIALKKIREVARISSEQLGDVEISYLSRIYGVSFWAAARRCEDLELLPRGGAWALHQHLKKTYGSAEKRSATAGLPPRAEVSFPPVPDRLLTAALDQIRSGTMSVGGVAEKLGLTTSDLYALHSEAIH